MISDREELGPSIGLGKNGGMRRNSMLKQKSQGSCHKSRVRERKI